MWTHMGTNLFLKTEDIDAEPNAVIGSSIVGNTHIAPGIGNPAHIWVSPLSDDARSVRRPSNYPANMLILYQTVRCVDTCLQETGEFLMLQVAY